MSSPANLTWAGTGTAYGSHGTRSGSTTGCVHLHGAAGQRGPDFPKWDVLEELEPGEIIIADDKSLGGGGPGYLTSTGSTTRRTWLTRSTCRSSTLVSPASSSTRRWRSSPSAVRLQRGRGAGTPARVPDGRGMCGSPRPSSPTSGSSRAQDNSSAAGPLIGWVVPLRRHPLQIFTLARVTEPDVVSKERTKLGGKLWEISRRPSTRASPAITSRRVARGHPVQSREILTTTDQGITMSAG